MCRFPGHFVATHSLAVWCLLILSFELAQSSPFHLQKWHYWMNRWMARPMPGGWHQRHVGGSSFRWFKVFGGTEFSQTEPFLDRLKTNSWPQNTWRRVECAEYLRVWSFIGHSKVVKTWQTWLVLNHRGQNLQEKFISRKTRKIRKWIKARREWREWKTPSMNSFPQAENEQLRKKLAKLEVATLGPLASPPRVFRGFLCALFSHVLARFPLFLNYFSSSFALLAPLFVFSLWRILFTFLFTGIRFAQGAVQAIRAIETDRAVFASTERETSKPWTKGLPKDYQRTTKGLPKD